MTIRPPRGVVTPDNQKKIAVSFPKDVFDELCKAVKTENKTFSQVVVDRVKCGQLCLSESDAMEPVKPYYDDDPDCIPGN